MAVMVYIPGIAIARAVGLAVEMIIDGLVFVAIFASLAIAAAILKNSIVLRGLAGWPLALSAFAILAVLRPRYSGKAALRRWPSMRGRGAFC
jgi:membrane protein implicated in regulation of membrane protease activity